MNSHPTIGSVGLSEAEAKEKHGEDKIKCYTTSVSPESSRPSQFLNLQPRYRADDSSSRQCLSPC